VCFNPEIITTGMIAMSKFLLILLMLASANAFAAISKWVDAQGLVHYSDQPPPPDTKAKTLRSVPDTGAIAGASGVPAQKTIAEREAELKKAQKAQKDAADKAAQKQANENAKKANCTTAQQSLRTLQEGMRMVQVDPNGERSYMDDAQRQQRIAQTQKDIDTNCK
jgi:hypothetical protein